MTPESFQAEQIEEGSKESDSQTSVEIEKNAELLENEKIEWSEQYPSLNHLRRNRSWSSCETGVQRWMWPFEQDPEEGESQVGGSPLNRSSHSC